MDLSVVAQETETKEADIARVFRNLKEPVDQDDLLQSYVDFSEEVIKHPQEMKQRAVPWDKFNSVYFLMQKGHVAYVGQTSHLAARLATHVHDGKKFDSVSWRVCRREDMLIIEAFNIEYHNPSLNISIPNKADLLRMVAKSI